MTREVRRIRICHDPETTWLIEQANELMERGAREKPKQEKRK